jgi:hypothetical protein
VASGDRGAGSGAAATCGGAEGVFGEHCVEHF